MASINQWWVGSWYEGDFYDRMQCSYLKQQIKIAPSNPAQCQTMRSSILDTFMGFMVLFFIFKKYHQIIHIAICSPKSGSRKLVRNYGASYANESSPFRCMGPDIPEISAATGTTTSSSSATNNDRAVFAHFRGTTCRSGR